MIDSITNSGFFDTEHYQELIGDKWDKGTFEIKFEDEGEFLPVERKLEIGNTIKAELIDRVLKTMASPTHLEVPSIGAYTPSRTENGAVVLAKGLDETCGFWNIFCKGASWIVRGLSATFADETAKSSFKLKYDYLASESWHSNEVKWRAAVTSFVGM